MRRNTHTFRRITGDRKSFEFGAKLDNLARYDAGNIALSFLLALRTSHSEIEKRREDLCTALVICLPSNNPIRGGDISRVCNSEVDVDERVQRRRFHRCDVGELCIGRLGHECHKGQGRDGKAGCMAAHLRVRDFGDGFGGVAMDIGIM